MFVLKTKIDHSKLSHEYIIHFYYFYIYIYLYIIFIYEYIENQGYVNKYIYFTVQDSELRFFFNLFDQIFKYSKVYNNKDICLI